MPKWELPTLVSILILSLISFSILYDSQEIFATHTSFDLDHDSILNNDDNCPNDSNPSQSNLDGDFFGDACDFDIDNDSIRNNLDTMPFTPSFSFSDITLGGNSIFVTTQHGGTNSKGEVFILAANGNRTVLTDFGDLIKGPLGLDPSGIVIEKSGTILVANGDINHNNVGNQVFRINPFTGDRTILADLKIPGPEPTAVDLSGIAVNDEGKIFVVDHHGGTELAASQGPLGALFSVDQFTGEHKLITDFGDLSQGPPGKSPFFMDIEDSGKILVANSISSNVIGKIFRVDPDIATGVNREIVFDFSNPTSGTPPAIGTAVIKIDRIAPGIGDWIIADFEATDDDENRGGALYRVPVSQQGSPGGEYSIITDFGLGPDELGESPVGFDFDSEGDILIADPHYPQGTTSFRGAVWSVDSQTGERSIFTNFGTLPVPVGAGPQGFLPQDVAVYKGGTTFGELITVGDNRFVQIVDAPNPEGIRVNVVFAGGQNNSPVQISVCDRPVEFIFKGENLVFGKCNEEPPVVSISEPTAGQIFSVNSAVFSATASDSEGTDITDDIIWTGNAEGEFFTGGSFQLIDLPPGHYYFRAAVTDSSDITGSSSVDIFVALDGVPVIEILEPTPSSNPETGELVQFSAIAIDVEDGDISSNIIWQRTDTGEILFTGKSFSTSFLDSDPFTVVATITDSQSKTSEDSVDFIFFNEDPIITSTPITSAIEGQLYNYDVEANDPNGDVLAFSLTECGLNCSIDSTTGLITWVPNQLDIGPQGNQRITVEVSDGMGGKATQIFNVDIEDVPPEITSAPITVATEHELYRYDVESNDPRPTTAYSLAGPNTATIDSATGLISWIPDSSHGGQEVDFTVTVTDEDNFSGNQQFTVSVINVNDPPFFRPFTVPMAFENEEFQLGFGVDDPDDGASNLIFSLDEAPTGMSAIFNTIEWTPTSLQVGDHTVTIRLTDPGGAFDTETFTITVKPAVVISGTVTDVSNGRPLNGIIVFAVDGDLLTQTGNFEDSVTQISFSTSGGALEGFYELRPLEPNKEYVIAFQAGSDQFFDEYYDGHIVVGPINTSTPVSDPSIFERVSVPTGTLSGINADLNPTTGSIEGQVTDAFRGNPVLEVVIYALDADIFVQTGGDFGASETGLQTTPTEMTGEYVLDGLEIGKEYIIAFDNHGSENFDEYYDGHVVIEDIRFLQQFPNPSTIETITVTIATPTISGIDAILASNFGAITGTVTEESSGQPLGNVPIQVLDADVFTQTGVIDTATVGFTTGDDVGQYEITDLELEKEYLVLFGVAGSDEHLSEFYDGQRIFGNYFSIEFSDTSIATPIVIPIGTSVVSGIDAALANVGAVIDVDNDGIGNEIDDEPNGQSLHFGDDMFPLEGSTRGKILDPGDREIILTDEPSPSGIHIVTGSSGTIDATIGLCPDGGGGGGGEPSDTFQSMLTFGPGVNEIIGTCGSVTLEVISGMIKVQPTYEENLPPLIFNEGANITIDDQTGEIINNSDEPAIILRDGVEITIKPGERIPVNEPPTAMANGPYLTSIDTASLLDSTGTFDPDGDDLIYQWSTTSSCTFDDATLASPQITCPETGILEISLTVTDPFGESDTDITSIVVYDPAGGFVTGGGWINSPAGAYTDDLTLDGKATFGFVSKYKKGLSQPTGQTEFQFKVADVNFHSSSYEWLVIAGHQAKYKGMGTINGEGNYGFMLSAVDAKLTPSADVDKFRIKIWDKDNGDSLVYDNQPGDTDDAELTTAIGGGSIVIHSGKGK